MNRPGSYEARNGMVWICGEPFTVTTATEHAHAFLNMTLTSSGDHWIKGWGEQLNSLVLTIREAKEQERALPVMEAA